QLHVIYVERAQRVFALERLREEFSGVGQRHTTSGFAQSRSLAARIIGPSFRRESKKEKQIDGDRAFREPPSPRFLMNRHYEKQNAAQLERLRALVSTLREDDLKRPLPNGWTIGTKLLHLAL